jgi:murein DD-endopeptidase MepM/ murein hydrolase activator NlpD
MFYISFSKRVVNPGIYALLNLTYWLIVILGGLLVPSISYGEDHIFYKDDEVVLISDFLNVRRDHEISIPHNANVKGSVPYGTEGDILQGPVVGPRYTWYEVRWKTKDNLEGWCVEAIDGCKTIITTEKARQKDELAEALFKVVNHDKTNHDYNDFGCSWDGDPYIGGHPGWDVQTEDVVKHPQKDFRFYSLTSGRVIRVGKIAHDFKTGKNEHLAERFPPEKRAELRETLEDDKTIAVYHPIDNKTTLYLHARRVFVVPGDDIFVGNCLGIQGKTGNALGVHVHIEVRDGEQPFTAKGDDWAEPPIPYLHKSIMENQIPAADVNRDGWVDIIDAKLVVENIGGNNPQFDINGDGTVNIPDLAEIVKYLRAYVRDLKSCPAAPSSPVRNQFENAPIYASQVSIGNVVVSRNMVQQWLDIAHETDDGSLVFKQSIAILKSLLITRVPQKTVLFANYPNPFNPETWIPYYLATDTDVTITIYNVAGNLVRHLDVGHQKAGYYTIRNRAAYWNGRSETGERVASGVYFYTLTTDRNTATRKMLILK